MSAQIIPWNYPIQIGARGIAPAIAAGCTVVLKPAEDAPMTAMRLGEIALECGLPPGVVNVLPGMGPEAGAALASHPDINQLTFTGSVSVGIAVAKMAADNVVPVVMELGGKSPNIVFADADLDLTVQGVANAIFQNAGQTCSAGSRLLVQRKAHDELVARLTERAERCAWGPGVSDPDMGPIISKKQLEMIEGYVKIGKSEGAHVAAGGARPSGPDLGRGFFFQPTLLDRVSPDMRVAQEEIFGPVLAIITFDEVEEAIAIANRSQYGLVAGVWTRDINKAMTVASRIKSGQVYINTYGAGGGVELPFGGYKKSGYGREKGLESLASYTQVKNVCVKFAMERGAPNGPDWLHRTRQHGTSHGVESRPQGLSARRLRRQSRAARPARSARRAGRGDCAAVAAAATSSSRCCPTRRRRGGPAGPGGVLARLRPGGAVMDMSTVDPLLTDRVAAAAAAKGSRSSTRRSDGWPAMPSAANRCSWWARRPRRLPA